MKEGFLPVYGPESAVLILGSFPSVMSRREGFYYGNPQNKFWGMLARFFGVVTPKTVAEKRGLVLSHGIALWDVVEKCEIEGSSDASIHGEQIADVRMLINSVPIRMILCNGAKSYTLLAEKFSDLLPMARRMPSTSPANPRYDEEVWHNALREVYTANSCGKGLTNGGK